MKYLHQRESHIPYDSIQEKTFHDTYMKGISQLIYIRKNIKR